MDWKQLGETKGQVSEGRHESVVTIEYDATESGTMPPAGPSLASTLADNSPPALEGEPVRPDRAAAPRFFGMWVDFTNGGMARHADSFSLFKEAKQAADKIVASGAAVKLHKRVTVYNDRGEAVFIAEPGK